MSVREVSSGRRRVASRPIQQGQIRLLSSLVGHRFQVCDTLRLLLVDDQQAFVLAPSLFPLVLTFLSAGLDQPIRRASIVPIPTPTQISRVRCFLRRFDLDISTASGYGYLLFVPSEEAGQLKA